MEHLWKHDWLWDAKKLSRNSLCEEFTLPSIQQKYENLLQNCSEKSSKIVQNWPSGWSGSIYLSFLLILGRVEKSLFFDVVLGRPKIDKNRALGRQGAAKCATIRRQGGDFWDRGPRGASRAELLNNKITGKWWIIWHADGRWPGELYIYIYIYIYTYHT